MEPHGFGALQLAFEQLKKKLAAEGLFDAARKRPLPALPRRIGIVTSIDGAALRDIIRVLRRRYPNAHLVIAPSRVQGEDSAGEIVRALRFIAQRPRRRCGHRRPRRRLARRSLGLQRRESRARDRGVSSPGDLRSRPRNRFHHRRFRRRPARADAVGRCRARRAPQGRLLRLHRSTWRPARCGDAAPALAIRIATQRPARASGLRRSSRSRRNARTSRRGAVSGVAPRHGRRCPARARRRHDALRRTLDRIRSAHPARGGAGAAGGTRRPHVASRRTPRAYRRLAIQGAGGTARRA